MQLPLMDHGPVGIWTSQFDFQPAARARKAAADLEKLGFGAIWFPESVGRESPAAMAGDIDIMTPATSAAPQAVRARTHR